MSGARLLLLGLLGTGVLTLTLGSTSTGLPWSAEEREIIASLALDALPPLPPDPSNHVADDPRAVALGQAFFGDTRLSGNGKVACASCHLPGRQFQDDLALGHGMGTTGRRTMPLAGMAYAPFLFWDGRKDSLWSQALGPMESAVEHGGDRLQYAHLIAAAYRQPYEALFGPLPDVDHLPAHAGPVADPEAAATWGGMAEADRIAVSQVFANIGKAIEAYERTIQPARTRFDAYVVALPSGDTGGIFTDDEAAGLKLFIGKGECVNCHNGPLLTDTHFHNTGVSAMPGQAQDEGRAAGVIKLLDDPFNCLGPFSDAKPDDCTELRFMATEGDDLPGAFKPPSLRGVVSRAPYMHAGQIATLDEVLAHYQAAPEAKIGHSELRPLGFNDDELRELATFLATLEPLPVDPQ